MMKTPEKMGITARTTPIKPVNNAALAAAARSESRLEGQVALMPMTAMMKICGLGRASCFLGLVTREGRIENPGLACAVMASPGQEES
ncbi:MAG: hypothetical protein AAGH88_04250 [Planctomycetota bacterium]